MLFFLGALLQTVVANTPFRKFYPNTLLSETGNLINGIAGPADIAGPLLVSIGLSILLFYLAGICFNKQEL